MRNNFWNDEVVRFGYIREMYLSRLDTYLGNNLVKVLLEQRRVGKSYILRMLIHHLITDRNIPPRNILYINKDLQDYSSINNSESLIDAIKFYRLKLKPKGKVYLLLDEIQEIQEWEKAINSLSQQYKEQYEIFITGSNANVLSSELSTYLSGRYVSFEVFPFSYSEYCGIKKVEKNKTSFLQYLKSGGMPEIYSLDNIELQQNCIASLKDPIVLRDIIQRNTIRDIVMLEKLVDFLIDSVGLPFSVNSVVKILTNTGYKTNNETVGNYLSSIKKAYFIHDCVRYDLKGRKILQGEKKFYLNDLAFKYYLSSSFDFGVGRYLENLIYMELRRQQYNVYIGQIHGRKIDFIAEKNGNKKYIQVTYLLSDEHVIQREFRNLELIKDNYEKLVISLDDVNMGNKEGIKHINAWDFCD